MEFAVETTVLVRFDYVETISISNGHIESISLPSRLRVR
jgi:hypothetical protein